MSASKGRNAMHAIRYIRRSGLSLPAQAVLVFVACETNGPKGWCDVSSRDIAADLGISLRQVERALEELRGREIVISAGKGRARALAIRDEAIVPGYTARTPPPAAGLVLEPRQNPAAGGGAPTYGSEDQTSGQTSEGLVEGSSEYSVDPSSGLPAEESTRRRELTSTRSGYYPPQKPVRETSGGSETSDPPRSPGPSEALARGAPTTPLPPTSRPPAGPAGAATVTGAQVDPVDPLTLAELRALEARANPEELPEQGGRTERVLRQRLTAGWSRAKLEAWFTFAAGRGVQVQRWTFLLGPTGWVARMREEWEAGWSSDPKPARPRVADFATLTPAELDARLVAEAQRRREEFDRLEREDDERRARALRLAAK